MTTQTKDITLGPGQSGQVSFEFVPVEARTHIVAVNGLSGSFEAIGQAPMQAQLKVGWNIVVYHGTPRRAADALASIIGYISVMNSYNEETGLWTQILADTILQTNATYYIRVTQDCTLTGFSIK